jgi:hypothetical protein
MKKIKFLSQFLGDFILISVVFYYWYDTGLTNPFACGLMSLLILQLVLQRIMLGLVVGAIFSFLTLWMALAFISDAIKIPDVTTQAITFICFGVVFCGLLLTGSILMIFKYATKKNSNGMSWRDKQKMY